MEIGENELYELLGKIESRDRVIEEQIRLNNDLPDIFAKAFAEQMSQYTQQSRQEMWSLPIEVDLSVARTVPTLIGEYPHGADAIIYLPDSSGVGTVYLDNPVSHRYEMGTDYQKLRAYFRNIYLTNIAQVEADGSARKLNLLVGQGDIDVRARTEIVKTVLGRNQQKWYFIWPLEILGESGAIPPESSVTVPIYAGRPGWQLYFGGGFLECDADTPQRVGVEILGPDIPMFIEVISWRFNLATTMMFQEPAIVRIESNEVMQMVFYNDDPIDTHNYSMVVLGMEEQTIA